MRAGGAWRARHLVVRRALESEEIRPYRDIIFCTHSQPIISILEATIQPQPGKSPGSVTPCSNSYQVGWLASARASASGLRQLIQERVPAATCSIATSSIGYHLQENILRSSWHCLQKTLNCCGWGIIWADLTFELQTGLTSFGGEFYDAVSIFIASWIGRESSTSLFSLLLRLILISWCLMSYTLSSDSHDVLDGLVKMIQQAHDGLSQKRWPA